MKLVNLDAALDAADHARAAAKQDGQPNDLASLIFDVAKHNIESYQAAFKAGHDAGYRLGFKEGHAHAIAEALKILDRAKVPEVQP